MTRNGRPLVFANLVDLADMRMIRAGGRAGFAPKSLAPVVIHAKLAKKLHRDRTVQILVMGAIHLAHAALAELLDDPIVRYRLA
jgi:hypothetical protein